MIDGEAQAASFEVGDIRKANCSRCSGIRSCEIRGHYTERYDDDDYHSITEWFILECRGCSKVFAQTVSSNTGDYDYYCEEDGSTATAFIETVEYWPALSKRRIPDWMSAFPVSDPIYSLHPTLLEIYGALNNDLRMLTAIGIRTAYDVATEILGIDPTIPFSKKLDALVSSGAIGGPDKDRLETMVDAGSASAHRGWHPTAEELSTIMDVLEHFVQETFIAPARRKQLDAAAAKIKQAVPARPDRKKDA